MKAGDCSPALPCMTCTSSQGLKPGMYRSVLTDHGSVVIINCYVPNAGGSKKDGGGRPRAQAKMRFLFLLQKKVDGLLQAGRQVCMSGGIIPHHQHLCAGTVCMLEYAQCCSRSLLSSCMGKTRSICTLGWE